MGWAVWRQGAFSASPKFHPREIAYFTSLTRLTYLAEPLYWLTGKRKSLGTVIQLVGIAPEAPTQFVLSWPPPLPEFRMAAQGQPPSLRHGGEHTYLGSWGVPPVARRLQVALDGYECGPTPNHEFT